MKYRWLLFVLVVAFLSHIIFTFLTHEIWWDAGVYIGMGKFLFSAGQAGLWEHIRPPLLPVFLGFFWWLNLSPVVFGRILEFLFMLGGVYFIYSLGKSWFDSERTGVIAALLLCFSPILFYLSFHLYTEIPAIFFVLLSLWLFNKNRFFLSGLAVGCAFLMKFPAGIFLPILCLFLIKRWRSLLVFCAGFAAIASPFFIISWIIYGSPLITLLAAKDAIGRALGCNVLRYKPWWHYFYLLIFSEIPFNALSLVGIFALFKNKVKVRYLLLACLILPLAYLMQLHCRDYRYLALFYPFVALLAAYSFVWLFRKVNAKVFAVFTVILTVWFAFFCINFFVGESNPPTASNYFGYLQGRPVEGEVWISNPIIATYTDAKLNKIYYPIYDEGVSKGFVDYVSDNHNISYVFLDNCGGGLICAENDYVCKNNTQKLITLLDNRFNRSFDFQEGRCWYRVWS